MKGATRTVDRSRQVMKESRERAQKRPGEEESAGTTPATREEEEMKTSTREREEVKRRVTAREDHMRILRRMSMNGVSRQREREPQMKKCCAANSLW